jgi:hypothetical protein
LIDHNVDHDAQMFPLLVNVGEKVFEKASSRHKFACITFLILILPVHDFSGGDVKNSLQLETWQLATLSL